MDDMMHQDDSSFEDSDLRFHTELFGFNRVEVLSYIERISAANAEKARALEDTIAALQRDLTQARQQGGPLAQKARQVFAALETQKKRAEDAVAEASALRAEVDQANDEIAAVRSRLFAKEQENEALRQDNDRLNETVEDLTRALTKRGASAAAAQPDVQVPSGADEAAVMRQVRVKAREILRAADEKAAAQLQRAKEDAAAIRANAQTQTDKAKENLTRSADGIAASISTLKEQLAAVDAKILAATSELQKATDGIIAALSGTEDSLMTLGAQVERFPEPKPAAVRRPSQSSYQDVLQNVSAAAQPVYQNAGQNVPAAAQPTQPVYQNAGQNVPAAAQPAQSVYQNVGQNVPAAAQPAQPVYQNASQNAPQPQAGAGYSVPGELYDPYARARREEDAYYQALRRVRYEDELRSRMYEEDRIRQEVARRQGYEEAMRDQAYLSRSATYPQASVPQMNVQQAGAAQAAAPQMNVQQPAVPQTAAPQANVQQTATAQAPAPQQNTQQPAAQSDVSGVADAVQPPVYETARPRYRATNGRPMPDSVQSANRAPQIEQYDSVQHAARSAQNVPYDNSALLDHAAVMQRVEIPQVPPQEQPESGSQVPFGKPHAPRAMPFAPFDPYTPHTAPYIEPDAEAARILNTPPPPPSTQGTEAKQPYVPQPTPIAPSVPLSGPYTRPVETAMSSPRQQPQPFHADEPVIIPYNAPIPATQGAEKQSAFQSADADALQRPPVRVAPSTGKDSGAPFVSRGTQESALSDDLLANLNALLDKDHKT